MKLRITVEGKTYDVDVALVPEAEGATETDDADFESRLPASVLKAPPPVVLPEDRICRSPIAGVIVAIVGAIGQRVHKDDPLLTIEAMKMISAIGAPVDGTVKAIHVAAGETVKPGQLLFELS